MTLSGQVTGSALQALLKDATLAGDWTLEESKSAIGLRSRSIWGLVPVKGVFRQVEGSGTVSAAGEVSGTVAVAAASVDTKNKKRDAHLRSPELLDSDAHPRIVFTLTGAEPSGDGAAVSGTITVRDRTRPVTFDARVSAFDAGEVWLDAEIPVNRDDFGLTWNQLGMASMHNVITVHAVFARS